MASKVSSPSSSGSTRSTAVTKSPRPQARPMTPSPTPRPSQASPTDTVSVGREADSGNTDRVNALTRGLEEGFTVGDSRPATDVSAPREEGVSSDPGQRSVDLARQFEGMESQDVAGSLGDFGSAGRHTNNCADFVSSVLEQSGRGIDRTESVGALREQLLERGWEVIPREEARPGDVWMTTSNELGNRHTELVTTNGGTHTIGSNNVSDTQQEIFERPKEDGMIYGYRPDPDPAP